MKLLLQWLTFYGVTYLIWILCLARGIHYISYPKFSALFFSVSMAAHFFWFRSLLSPVFASVDLTAVLLVIILTIVVNLILYKVIHTFLRKPEAFIRAHPADHNIPMVYKGLFSKFFEIGFQQISFAVLTCVAFDRFGWGAWQGYVLIVAIFSFFHLTTYFFLDRFFATYYSFTAFFGSLLFAYLLANYYNGILFAYFIHSIYYALTGLITWLVYGGIKRRHT